MQRQKRAFYIIAHNPNTVEEAAEFLKNGANALEPDVVHSDGKFYISHSELKTYADCPTVEEYLQQLKQLVIENNYNLALIVFDIKNTDFDINRLLHVIVTNFSGGFCDGVALLLTHSDDTDFLIKCDNQYSNVGIGVDETNTPPSEVESIFRNAGHKNFSYADGITTFLTKPGVYTNIVKAQECRDANENVSFKLIYTWSLQREASMRKYLNTYIDGIFVDVPYVKKLKNLVLSSPYDQVFYMARNGHNPFDAPPIPRYKLVIKTSDKHLAGTDASLLFTLTGTSGISLSSLPYDASLTGALERNSTSFVTIEGKDVGEIKTLTVEMLSSDVNSDWLPEKITVESKLLPKSVSFIVNGDGLPEQWITKKAGATTLIPLADVSE